MGTFLWLGDPARTRHASIAFVESQAARGPGMAGGARESSRSIGVANGVAGPSGAGAGVGFGAALRQGAGGR